MCSRLQLDEGRTPVAMVAIISLDFQFMSDFAVFVLASQQYFEVVHSIHFLY